MHYVYLLQSVNYLDQRYVGYTEDFDQRLIDHNSGSSCHTKQYKPWKIVVVFRFEEKLKALNF